jgi:N-acetylglucosamine kinase-like BadF-type ATPase
LTEAFLGRFQLRQPQELVPVIYRGGLDRTALAELAPLVFTQADRGDDVAMGLVIEAVSELAGLVAAVSRQLGMAGKVPLAMAGGCLVGSLTYQGHVSQALTGQGVQVGVVTTIAEPAAGAVRLAARARPLR